VHFSEIIVGRSSVTEFTLTEIMNTRRNFLTKLVVSVGTPALLCNAAFGQAPPAKLEETDPTAVALGYKEDTTKVDATKYAQHKADQVCSGCALYTGKVGDATGPCGAFGGKLVTAAGWCAVYAKKPEAAK
jgi:hypothetical protein